MEMKLRCECIQLKDVLVTTNICHIREFPKELRDAFTFLRSREKRRIKKAFHRRKMGIPKR